MAVEWVVRHQPLFCKSFGSTPYMLAARGMIASRAALVRLENATSNGSRARSLSLDRTAVVFPLPAAPINFTLTLTLLC
jgi:hypothetical protein